MQSFGQFYITPQAFCDSVLDDPNDPAAIKLKQMAPYIFPQFIKQNENINNNRSNNNNNNNNNNGSIPHQSDTDTTQSNDTVHSTDELQAASILLNLQSTWNTLRNNYNYNNYNNYKNHNNHNILSSLSVSISDKEDEDIDIDINMDINNKKSKKNKKKTKKKEKEKKKSNKSKKKSKKSKDKTKNNNHRRKQTKKIKDDDIDSNDESMDDMEIANNFQSMMDDLKEWKMDNNDNNSNNSINNNKNNGKKQKFCLCSNSINSLNKKCNLKAIKFVKLYPLKCKYNNCLRLLRNKKLLKKHEINDHPTKSKKDKAKQRIKNGYKDKETPFDCQYCDKSFKSKSGLSKHETNEHPISRPFHCKHCEKGYKVEWRWKQHQRQCPKKKK